MWQGNLAWLKRAGAKFALLGAEPLVVAGEWTPLSSPSGRQRSGLRARCEDTIEKL